MTRSERIAKRICKALRVWKKDHARLIVAIDGYAGAGKTTIAKHIADCDADVLSIHLDDFIRHWRDRKRMMGSTKDKPGVFEYHWYRYGDLEKLMRAFLRGKKSISITTYNFETNDFLPKQTIDLTKKVLVIDGIFLLHPAHRMNKLFHKTIYLDADHAVADKRRIAREKKRWGKNFVHDDHPDNWVNYFKTAYRRYIKKYKPGTRADLVCEV